MILWELEKRGSENITLIFISLKQVTWKWQKVEKSLLKHLVSCSLWIEKMIAYYQVIQCLKNGHVFKFFVVIPINWPRSSLHLSMFYWAWEGQSWSQPCILWMSTGCWLFALECSSTLCFVCRSYLRAILRGCCRVSICLELSRTSGIPIGDSRALTGFLFHLLLMVDKEDKSKKFINSGDSFLSSIHSINMHWSPTKCLVLTLLGAKETSENLNRHNSL